MLDHEKQYSILNVSVGTVKKSNATITSRRLARKASQRLPGSPRRCRRRRCRAIVRSETEKPSFSSSPWIFGAPQSEFSAAMRWMRLRVSSLILGCPRRGWDRQRQYLRKPARCQPTTVSGFTISKTSDHRGQTRRRLSRTGGPRSSMPVAAVCVSAQPAAAAAPGLPEVCTRPRKNTRMAARNARVKSSTNEPL